MKRCAESVAKEGALGWLGFRDALLPKLLSGAMILAHPVPDHDGQAHTGAENSFDFAFSPPYP
jgi:hypothetical protein